MFIFAGLDKDVSHIAAKFIHLYMPSVFLMGFNSIDRIFMTSFGRADIPFYASLLNPVLQLVCSYLFMIVLDLELIGLAIACLITQLTVVTV